MGLNEKYSALFQVEQPEGTSPVILGLTNNGHTRWPAQDRTRRRL
jgi:hypothetical protein